MGIVRYYGFDRIRCSFRAGRTARQTAFVKQPEMSTKATAMRGSASGIARAPARASGVDIARIRSATRRFSGT